MFTYVSDAIFQITGVDINYLKPLARVTREGPMTMNLTIRDVKIFGFNELVKGVSGLVQCPWAYRPLVVEAATRDPIGVQ